MGTELPTDEHHTTPAAHLRLYEAVLKLPTIEDSASSILLAIDKCEEMWHWHGHDGKFIEKLGSKKSVMDLGKCTSASCALCACTSEYQANGSNSTKR